MPPMDRRFRLLSLARLPLVLSSILGLGLACIWPSPVNAAKLSAFLTPQDLARPILLDQSGRQLQLPSPGHPQPVLPPGSTPTYLAIPLLGGEHLPAGIPTFHAGSSPEDASTGPFGFEAMIKAELNAALGTFPQAVVDTSNRNYVIEFVPHRKPALSGAAPGAGLATPIRPAGTGAATTESSSGGSSPSTTSANNPVSELAQLFKGGTIPWSQWSVSSVNAVENLLDIKSSNPTATKPSLNLEAQVLDSPLPAPIPEPGTWLFFGLILAATAIGRSPRRRPSLGT
jgi:hypothetical protein